MGISRSQYNTPKNQWFDVPFENIKAGTTQIKKVIIDGTIIWATGIFSAGSVDYQGLAGYGQSAGTFTFDVISSTGNGSGGSVTGYISWRRFRYIVSVVNGGTGHEIGDILTIEMTTGNNWSADPKIEVTAL